MKRSDVPEDSHANHALEQVLSMTTAMYAHAHTQTNTETQVSSQPKVPPGLAESSAIYPAEEVHVVDPVNLSRREMPGKLPRSLRRSSPELHFADQSSGG